MSSPIRYPWAALSVLFTFSACVTTQVQKPTHPELQPSPKATFQPWELEILNLEGQRATADGALVKLAESAEKTAVRSRAVLALGRVQDLSTLSTVLRALQDKEAAVRTQAAFASGLMALSWQGLDEAQKTQLSTALLEAEAAEKERDVKAAVLEALGKVANAAAVERLIARLEGDELLKVQAMLSLGIAAKRGAKLPATVLASASAALSQPNDTPRYVAAYVLMQSKVPEAREGLLKGLSDTNGETRALCAKGLGDVALDTDSAALSKLLGDGDYRVAAEATRSLTKMVLRCYAEKPAVKGAPVVKAPAPKAPASAPARCEALAALEVLESRPDEWLKRGFGATAMPILVLAQAGLPASAVPLLKSVRASLKKNVDGSSKAVVVSASANLDCRLAAAIDRAQGYLHEVFACGDGKVTEANALALGLSELSQAPPASGKGPWRALEALPYLSHADAKVKSAAVGAVASGQGPKAVEALKVLLKDSDIVLVGGAASGLAALKDKASLAAVLEVAKKVPVPELAPALGEALGEFGSKDAIPVLTAWLTSPHPVVRHSAATALTKLQGKPVPAPHISQPTAPVISEEWSQRAVEVKTEKGNFVVRLYGTDAPRTVGNFVELAKKGFYKNITFHRIVPNFVVQGGDPRGDGEGGPGYLIPCEINEHRYLRGTVGMALSGKDTGGSQFFVSTSAQPHLDGRYTSFGDVVSGMEVVDALLEGDRIIDIAPVLEAGPITKQQP
jgi:cyclophilin family peptidyl-prolyl cis-trans isomerase/HEAT repeat protein